jgi:hypothetical protein
MRCPKCGHEPRDRLLHKPCTECGHVWVDTESYCHILGNPISDIQTVLDIGCGRKGIIGQYYWEEVRHIKQGYACDIHVLKDLPPLWKPLLTDAENLLNKLGTKSVDVVTHCGFLEHVPYAKALRILYIIEQLAKKLVFFTCSAVVREVDYKVKQDGNPYHYYRSFWDGDTFEALGYHVDRRRMCDGTTFLEETTCWFDPGAMGPWRPRCQEAIRILTDRRCIVPGCDHEPIWWDPRLDNRKGGCLCFRHAEDRNAKQGHGGAPIKQWYDDPDKLKMFPIPPWRDALKLKEKK